LSESRAPEPHDPSGGDELLRFVRDELDKENERRKSIESRGLSLASVAGAIVTLASGLQRFAGDASSTAVHGAERVVLTASMVLFAVTALLAALTNAPRGVSLVDAGALEQLAPGLWEQPADDVRKRLFASQLVYLADAQRTNDWRGRMLFAATVTLSAAVLALGVVLSVGAT
jgi:hypothetical protein